MRKRVARYILKKAIKGHEIDRKVILEKREAAFCIGYSPNHDKYCEELWHQAAAELRCIDRLTKLLNQYL